MRIKFINSLISLSISLSFFLRITGINKNIKLHVSLIGRGLHHHLEIAFFFSKKKQ
jgi:hypothetical protein